MKLIKAVANEWMTISLIKVKMSEEVGKPVMMEKEIFATYIALPTTIYDRNAAIHNREKINKIFANKIFSRLIG
jgi:hypothetical protein